MSRITSAQTTPPICFTGIDPFYTNVDVTSFIHVTNPADVAAIRNNVIAYLWKGNGWPGTNMPTSVTTVPTPDWVNGIGSTNVDHVDRVQILMDYSISAVVYHIHAAQSVNRLLLYHNGHGTAFIDDDDDMVRTTRLFLDAGHDVMIFCMPLDGENSQGAVNVPGYGSLPVTFINNPNASTDTQGHNRMAMMLENQQGSFIRFFVEPVVVALNYALANYNYLDVNMVGISGGGWATHMCAAIDPRIGYSFPVAGSLPLYLRTGECWTGTDDAEQVWAPLYVDRATWLDLYILGAYGDGRQQTHILNQYDDCCFGGVQYLTYEPYVDAVVSSLGAGLYQVYVDMGQTHHTISDSVLTNVIFPAIAGKLLGSAPQFSGLSVLNITTNSAVLLAQLANVSADVSLFWDTSDKGTDPAAWGNSVTYRNVAAGSTISNLVIGLAPATPYFFRLYGTNTTYSTATWSPTAQFATAEPPLAPRNFNYGMKITFQGFGGGEVLSNFPVLIKLSTNLSGGGFSYAQFASNEGGDLRFAASDGVTPLNFEIEKWDTSGVSYVWVEVPKLASNSDFIWAYWGNPAQPALPHYALDGSTWENGFAGVWHLKEDQPGVGTIGLYADSSPGRHPGDDMVSATGKEGVIDGGQQFDGIGDYIPIADFELPNAFTISAWFKSTETGSDFYQIVARGNTSDTLGFYLALNDSTVVAGGNDGGGWTWAAISQATAADGTWHQVACIFDPSSSSITGYIDGQPTITTNLFFDANAYAPKQTTLGRNQNGHGQYFPGWIDEVQISNASHSSNWVWNAWFNTVSNSTFCGYGQVQQSPGSGQPLLKISSVPGQPSHRVSFDSAPGWIYRLQYRDTLGTGIWQTLDWLSITSVAFGPASMTDTNTSTRGFYRTLAEPH